MGYSDLLDKADFSVIQALADYDMCVIDAAKATNRSDSGIWYRIHKIRRITGRDPKNFYDLMWFVTHMKNGRPINEEEWYA